MTGASIVVCLARSVRHSPSGLFDFLRVPLIALIGWSFYGEALDALVLAGAGLIMAGMIWNLRTEARGSAQLEKFI